MYQLRPENVIFGGGVIDSILNKFTASPYQGEHHARVNLFGHPYSYVGPSTRLDIRLDENNKPTKGNEPLNKLDESAMEHDISYRDIAKEVNEHKITKDQGKKQIWAADDKFRTKAKQQKDDVLVGQLASKFIHAKEIGEKTGVLDTKKFSGFGASQKSNPAARLKMLVEDMNKKEAKANKQPVKIKQDGGFAFLAPILASLAGSAVSSLFGTIVDKIRGNGMSVPFKYYKGGTEGKRKFLLRLAKTM